MDVALNPAMLALKAILEDVAETRSARAETVRIQSMTSRHWRDSCLGAPEPDEVCTSVETAGFVIDLEGGLRYHTDVRGGFRRVKRPMQDTEIRVRFERDGGIVPGHVEFKTGSDTLTFEAEEELRQLIEEADFFDVSSGVPGGSPDVYTYTIWIAVGRRSHVVMFRDDAPLPGPKMEPLLNWLTLRLPERGRGNVMETSVL